MPEIPNVVWTRDLARLVENRSGRRTTVQPNQQQAWNLVGVDGFSRSGISPMAGFKKLPEDLGLGSSNVLQPGDFWVVTMPVSATTAYTGYLYRYQIGGSGNYVVQFKWYNGTTWEDTSLTPIFTQATAEPMDIAMVGRVLYVCIRGTEPAALYFEETDPIGSPGVYDLVVLNDTGPGPNPHSVKIGDQTNATFVGLATCLDNRVVTGEPYADLSVGRIIVNDQIDTRGSDYPEFEPAVVPGNDKPTGETPLKYQPGAYSFAFELVDSRTNLRSQLSEIIELEPEDFKDAVSVTTSTTYNVGKRSYILFEVIVDTTKYDQVYLYRSVRNPPDTTAGPLQSALFLEKILTSANNLHGNTLDLRPRLEDSLQFERWFFYCVLDDQALLVQDPYFNRVVVDEDMPKGGAVLPYEGIMIMSDISGTTVDTVPNQSDVGEIRYSSTLIFSPESFPPNNRAVPPVRRDTPIAWVQAAGNALGLSPNRAYFTRASGGFIEFEPIANGFGLASRRGLSAIAEMVFYVSSTGIKVIDANGRLDAMSAFDNVIQEDWATTLDDVFMVYDPDAKVLWTINPDTREGLLIWMETSTPSSVQDLPFVAGWSGLLPEDQDAAEVAQFATSDGRIYVYDRKRTKTDGSGNTRTAILDWSGAARVVVGSVGSPTAGVYPLTITTSDFPTDGSLTDAFLYVADGPRRGERYRITIVNSATACDITSDEGYDPTGLSGETLEVSPVFVRWVDAPIDLQSPDGFQFGASDRFRSRSASTLSLYCSDVEGSGAGSAVATYSATLWRGNLGSKYTWGQPKDNNGDVVEAIVSHNPDYASLFQYSSDLPVTDSVITPGIDIFVTDLDYLAIAARITGTVQHTSRTRGA